MDGSAKFLNRQFDCAPVTDKVDQSQRAGSPKIGLRFLTNRIPIRDTTEQALQIAKGVGRHTSL